MTTSEIIRESEKEHAAPCRIGEWRTARLNPREAEGVRRAVGKKLRGWRCEVVEVKGWAVLRYTRDG